MSTTLLSLATDGHIEMCQRKMEWLHQNSGVLTTGFIGERPMTQDVMLVHRGKVRRLPNATWQRIMSSDWMIHFTPVKPSPVLKSSDEDPVFIETDYESTLVEARARAERFKRLFILAAFWPFIALILISIFK